MGIAIFIVLFFIYFINYLFCSEIKPFEFNKKELLKIYKESNNIEYDPEKNTLDADKTFNILKLLSICNINKKNFINIISNFLCKNTFYTYYVKIKNINIRYGDTVHSNISKYIKEINFICKYYIYDNSYEIIKCYDVINRLDTFYLGFEIEKRYENKRKENGYNEFMKSNNLLKKNENSSEKKNDILYHSNENNSNKTIDNYNELHISNNVENANISYLCKLKMNINSYITDEESIILKVLIGLCVKLGYKKQFFISENAFALVRYFEKNKMNHMFNLGFDVYSSKFYNPKDIYVIKSMNSFINTNKELLRKNIPNIYFKFFPNKSYLLWRGIEQNKEIFNYKLLELKNLLEQSNYKERISLCYKNYLQAYYEGDEKYLKKKLGSKIKYSNFRSLYSKKLNDFFLLSFEYFCDNNVLSFEQCISNIMSSKILDEKAKSIMHQFLYESFLCFESCSYEDNFNIFNNDIVIKKLQEYINWCSSLSFKTENNSKKIREKIRKNSINEALFPQDDNIQKDFFENTMFSIEFESVTSLIKDELDKLNLKESLENKICNITKYIKYHEQLYKREYTKYNNRKLEESILLDNLFSERSINMDFDDLIDNVYDEKELNNFNFSIKDIQNKIINFDLLKYDNNNNNKEETNYGSIQEEKNNYEKNNNIYDELGEYDNIQNDSFGKKNPKGLGLLIHSLIYKNNVNQKLINNKITFHHSFIMGPDEKEILTLQNQYDYDILQKIYKKNEVNDNYNNNSEVRRKNFFNFFSFNNYYNFSITNVPTKFYDILKRNILVNNDEKNKSNIFKLQKRDLKFLCTKGNIWPYSKILTKFSENGSIHCEAQFENELSISIENEEQTFEYLLNQIKKSNYAFINEKKNYNENENLLKGIENNINNDSYVCPEDVLYNIRDNYLNENSSSKSQIVGFHFFNRECTIKYIGDKKYYINNPILSKVLLKAIFGFCILHGFTTLKVEAETFNFETGIKTKFHEILLNGITEYEHLGLKLMNVAKFSKELYYIITGYNLKNDLLLSAVSKFDEDLYIHHNIESNFFNYVNKRSMNMLHKLSFNCNEDYYPYKNCYDIYPLVRKNKENYCYFEINDIFKELNELFPDVCKMGSSIGKCYEQIKKNIICSNNSEGCKYYNFIINTFIKPRRKTSFFIHHNMNVQEYLSKKSYKYYLILYQLIKNGKNHLKEYKNNEYITDTQTYFLLNYILQNSTFFIFWNFSTEFWRRFQYIHEKKNVSSFFRPKIHTEFCPMAYTYEFIYHLNTFYIKE
ncbi:conserved Plasmodium protein, unknown function [Plasmodium relictum]|uniref:Uncharacterized protein n=1 Tax=Plasmodium relictum TaxID=85471 RepID=A0A1J1HAF9_PLARL|nr:conserved Plasmodium protein, unknown function [Plasmodium relictum]CRH02449.1 conserved Plasmodium protein, unknown function [Plasmodium relictum]